MQIVATAAAMGVMFAGPVQAYGSAAQNEYKDAAQENTAGENSETEGLSFEEAIESFYRNSGSLSDEEVLASARDILSDGDVLYSDLKADECEVVLEALTAYEESKAEYLTSSMNGSGQKDGTPAGDADTKRTSDGSSVSSASAQDPLCREWDRQEKYAQMMVSEGAVIREMIPRFQVVSCTKKDNVLEWDWTCLDNWKLEYWGTLISVTSITLSETSVEMFQSEMHDLTANVAPENATYRNVNWSSTKESVATVDSKGQITAVGIGVCYIVATAKDGSGKKAQCRVTVKRENPTAENVIINEIMAANVDVYLDPSFNYGSWVELYNPTDKSVTLGNLYISDNPNNLKKNRLLSNYGALPAKGYALLNFDHHEVWTQASYRQINDKLDCDGGVIIISDGTKIIVQQEYPASIARTSYARKTDGGAEWGYTGNPSPGSSNQTNGGFATAQLDAPVVDKDGQLFSGTLQVSVSFPKGATLKYTTDGTAPTQNNGEVSKTGIFSVNKTTCYRFRVFQNGYLPSQVVTRSFIKNDRTYPFPIISLVTKSDNLNSSEYGVFQKGPNGRPGNGQTSNCNWNMDWDRPVSFEFITDNNEYLVSQECDLSVCGGWTRASNPKSFKLKATKTYDMENFFQAQFFDEKPHNKNKTLQIRNGGNDGSCRIKDAAIQQVVARSGLYVDYQALARACRDTENS